MTIAKKLYLQNLIFARALTSGSAVNAVRGGLASPSADALLQVLIFYYNVFFRLPYDPNANTCEPYAQFLSTRTHRPFFAFAGVGILRQDLPAELWYDRQG